MKITFYYCVFLILVSLPQVAGSQPGETGYVLESVRIDTLLKTVSQLSGEEEVIINDKPQRIKTRSSYVDSAYTYAAEEYLVQRLNGYGYETHADTFNIFKYSNPSSTNIYRHIYAVKEGIKYPGKRIYFTAHFDCVGDFPYLNYGADDNASGTAVVLEAARIFSKIGTDFSIVFMLFNSEEIGGNSQCHFDYDSTIRKEILAAINIDMIAYDANNDGKMNIFYHLDQAGSLIQSARELNDKYKVGLTVNSLFGWAGDDIRFYGYGIPAITFFEDGLMGEDMNPGYHSNKDRMSSFNNTYFEKMAKLSIATLSELAFERTSGIPDINKSLNTGIFPNPASDYIFLPDENSIDCSYDILNIFGVSALKGKTSGRRIFVGGLQPGIYLIKHNKTVAKFIKI